MSDLATTLSAGKVHIYGERNMAQTSSVTGDGPFGGLAPADKTLLINPPIEVAIIEVRFSSKRAEISANDALAVRDALASATGVEFPTIQPTSRKQWNVDFGSEPAVRADQEVRGWQILSTNGRRSVTLMPDSVALQANEYEHWSATLREPLAVLVGLLTSLFGAELIQRVGLRYIDRFDGAGAQIQSWKGRIADSLLGPLLNEAFGSNVTGSQQEVEIYLEAQRSALLRHGPLLDAARSATDYLLDIDVFDQQSARFDVDDLLLTADRLNRTSLALFQACLVPAFLIELQGGLKQ
jgi:uncharacterized protein (TIGR04255 family)